MTVDLTELNNYIEYLDKHGRRPTTIRNLYFILRSILKRLDEAGFPTSTEKIGVDEILWLDQNLDVGETTRHEYLREISVFVRHFTGRDPEKQADILHNRPMVDRVFISKEDFYKMLSAAKPPERVILVLGTFMGLRRKEIAEARWRDITYGKLTVHGKGHGKDGLVAKMDIPDIVMEELERFREYRLTHGKDQGYDSLVQLQDHAGRWYPICVETVSSKIKALGDSVGVHATTHSLRRLYATILYNECETDTNTLRILMRHADVSTTLKCYVDPDPMKPIAAMDKFLEKMTP